MVMIAPIRIPVIPSEMVWVVTESSVVPWVIKTSVIPWVVNAAVVIRRVPSAPIHRSSVPWAEVTAPVPGISKAVRRVIEPRIYAALPRIWVLADSNDSAGE